MRPAAIQMQIWRNSPGVCSDRFSRLGRKRAERPLLEDAPEITPCPTPVYPCVFIYTPSPLYRKNFGTALRIASSIRPSLGTNSSGGPSWSKTPNEIPHSPFFLFLAPCRNCLIDAITYIFMVALAATARQLRLGFSRLSFSIWNCCYPWHLFFHVVEVVMLLILSRPHQPSCMEGSTALLGLRLKFTRPCASYLSQQDLER